MCISAAANAVRTALDRDHMSLLLIHLSPLPLPMLLTTVLFATSLPVCLVSLALGVRAPALPSASFLNGRRAANESYLEALSETQRQVFDYVLDALDENFSPPFLVSNGWYCPLVF